MLCDRALLSAILLLVLVALAGCAEPGPTVTGDDAIIDATSIEPRQGNRGDGRPDPRAAVLEEVEEVTVDSAWTESMARNFRFSLAPDGSTLATVERSGDGSYVVRARNAAGDIVWTYTTPERHYVSSNVRMYGSGAPVGLALYRTDGTGSLRILDDEGGVIYERSLAGPSGFALSDRGETLALLDRLSGEMRIVGLQPPAELGWTRAGDETLFRFVPGTDLILLLGREDVQIVGPDATSLWEQQIDSDLRGGVCITEGGQRIALTTRDPDGAVYALDRSEGIMWRQLLFPGGRNDLHFSADGSRLLIYNVGVEGGVFLYDMDSGDLLWRCFVRLDGDEDGHLRIDDAGIDDEGRVTAHLVVCRNLDSGAEESHYLLFLSPSGEVTGRIFLGVNVQVRLARDGKAAAVASGEPDEGTGARILDSLSYYNFTGGSAILAQ